MLRGSKFTSIEGKWVPKWEPIVLLTSELNKVKDFKSNSKGSVDNMFASFTSSASAHASNKQILQMGEVADSQ